MTARASETLIVSMAGKPSFMARMKAATPSSIAPPFLIRTVVDERWRP
jgi:hypothetical protein